MKKFISFSLYGTAPKYCIGALKNIHLAKHWYPDYKVAIYMDDSVPLDVKTYAMDHGADVRRMSPELGAGGMFHRFLINDDLKCERYLIRDADSRINEREVKLVRIWEESGKPFHVVRDHPHHSTDILGGVWGATRDAIGCTMEKRIKEWTGVKEGYDADQQFLREVIWPRVKHHALQHDSCTRNKYKDASPIPVPLSYDNPRFCCEVFDHLDRPRAYDWEKMLMAVEVEPCEEFGGGAPLLVTDGSHKAETGAPYDPQRGRDDESNKHQEVSNPPATANLKPPLFIRTHLGLGDALIQNGLVRWKAEEHERVIFPCKVQNAPTVMAMFADLENVEVVPVASDSDRDKGITALYGDIEILGLGMFADKWNEGAPGWDKEMYEQAGVPWEQRWDGFRVPNMDWFKLNVPTPKFVVVHDDSSRRFTIPRTRLPKATLIWIGPSMTLIDFVPFLRDATEIHCIDSCVAILADSIPTVAEKLVLHLYARRGAKPPTYRKKWEILKK